MCNTMSITSYLRQTGSTLACSGPYSDWCAKNRVAKSFAPAAGLVQIEVAIDDGSQSMTAYTVPQHQETEEEIAGHLSRLWPGYGPSSAGAFRFALPQESGATGSQQAAMAILSAAGGGCLRGGPGTGKTWLAGQMIKAMLKSKLDVAVAAPTGKAASVLSAKLGGLEVLTIHSLLGMTPKDACSKYTPQLLECDALFIDEMSMVDNDVMLQLLRSVKSTTHLFFIGDEHQIDPIGPGAPFCDIIDLLPTATLTDIVRQEAGNGIIEFAAGILSSNFVRPQANVTFIDTRRPEEMAFEMFGEYDLDKDKVLILCPVKDAKFDASIITLNHRISVARNGEPIDDTFRVGDFIQFNSNTKEYGFVNGERGTIVSYEKTGARANTVSIRNENGRFYNLKNYSLKKHADLGYAMTVHKAQGSECDNVILIVPREAQHMLTEQLLYTAATRAKKHLIVLGELSLVQMKVKQQRVWRQTILYGLLRGCIEQSKINTPKELEWMK